MIITRFISSALSSAHIELLEDGTYYAQIDGFEGVWANASTKQQCMEELQEVLEEWLILKIRKKTYIPTTNSYTLNSVLA